MAPLRCGVMLSITANGDTQRRRVPPLLHSWADPAYALVHASIVDTNRALLAALRGTGPAETSGRQYLETMRLVFAAYESARTGQVVLVSHRTGGATG